jgi:hypothetical protein
MEAILASLVYLLLRPVLQMLTQLARDGGADDVEIGRGGCRAFEAPVTHFAMPSGVSRVGGCDTRTGDSPGFVSRSGARSFGVSCRPSPLPRRRRKPECGVVWMVRLVVPLC